MISVIVPVYKVEKYLPQCIESILCQSYKDFEVILVDDGSPDNSGALCDTYAKKDSRINVIHKENGGVSSARNAGLDSAKGDWICFVDSDDWVEPDFLQELLNTVIASNSEVAVCGIVGEKRKPVRFLNWSSASVALFSQKGFGGFSWQKIVKADLVNGDEKIRYNVDYRYLEDSEFFLRVFKKCKRITWNNLPLYNYRENTESVTQQKNNMEIVNHAFSVMDDIIIRESNRRIRNAVELQKLNFEFGMVLAAMKKNSESAEIGTYLHDLKIHLFLILTSLEVKIKRKIAVYLILFFPFFFRVRGNE